MDITFNTTLRLSAIAGAVQINDAPSFSIQPQVGVPLVALPASATGVPEPTVSYSWYLGPASDDVVLSGVTGTTYDAPVVTQIGQPIGIRATASNGVSADDTADGLSGLVSILYEDDWLEYTIGDTDDTLRAGDWTATGSLSNNLLLVSNAGSDTGRGMGLDITTNTPTSFYRSDINAALTNAPTGMMMESVYVVDVNDPGSRFMLRNGTGYTGGAGVSCRIGEWYHQLPGDDATLADGVGLGNFDNKTIVIRHRIEGAVSSVWIWDITTAEPSTPTSVRTYEVATVVTNIPLHAPAIGMGQTGAGVASQVLYMSCGLAASAPISDVFPVIAATGADALAFIAATERGATYNLIMNNQITVTLEDLP